MTDYSSLSCLFVVSDRSGVIESEMRTVLHVCEALLREGAEVHLVATPECPLAGAAHAAGVSVSVYRLGGLNALRTRSRLRKYLRKHGLVVAHSLGAEADALLLSAARGLPVRTVAMLSWRRLAGVAPRGPRHWLWRRGAFRRLEHADVLLADSRRARDVLVADGADIERTLVAPPVVDVGAVAHAAEGPHAHEVPRVAYAGPADRGSGLEVLERASALLAARGAGIRTVVARPGPPRLLDGFATPSEQEEGFAAALADADVCCFPAVSPRLPAALLAAAALAKPIVTTSASTAEELFVPGREIVVVPAGDPEALADAIAETVADPDRARSLGEAARHRTMDEYSTVAGAKWFLALYRRLALS